MAIGEALEERERKAAEQRKRDGQKSGGRGHKKLAENFPVSKSEENRSISRVAKSVGMSRLTAVPVPGES